MMMTFIVWMPLALIVVVVRLLIKLVSLTTKLAMLGAKTSIKTKTTAVKTVSLASKGIKKADSLVNSAMQEEAEQRKERKRRIEKEEVGEELVNKATSMAKDTVKSTVRGTARLSVKAIKNTPKAVKVAYKAGKGSLKATKTGVRLGVKAAKKVPKIAKNTYKVGKLTVKVAKTGVKTTVRVIKTVPKVVEAGARLTVTAIRLLILLIKALITAISALISVIASMGIIGVVCVVILTVAVVAGGVFMTFWDDVIEIQTKVVEYIDNMGVNKSGSSGDDKVTIGNPKLEDLDIAVLKYKVDKSKSSHKKNCSTSLSRKDVTKFANLLMGKGNTMSRGGATVCKYLCYSQTNSWGRASSCNVIDLDKFSKSATVVNSGTLECKAGIPFSKSKVYVMDCSTFIGWFYATFFVAYDRNNKDIDELANWYIGLRSIDYDRTDLNKKIDRKDLKPGDIIHVTSPHGHVCMYIGNGKCIGASQDSTGIKLGNLSYYESNSTVSYHRPYFKFRGE